MPEAMHGRVGEQHAAYRKGLVLGLTLAEVGTLIIFVLLLLIGYQQTRHRRALADLAALQERLQGADGKETIDRGRLAELTEDEGRLAEVARALGIKVTSPKDDFRRLSRVVEQAAASSQARQDLGEANRALEEIKGAAQQMRALTKGNDALVKQAEAQSYRIANQEGQLRRYEKQLADAGQGKGERPCWVEPDGTIDFLYDVTLGSRGIRMRERLYGNRTQERSSLPMPVVDPDESMTEVSGMSKNDDRLRRELAAALKELRRAARAHRRRRCLLAMWGSMKQRARALTRLLGLSSS
jgi:hypothetical protein